MFRSFFQFHRTPINYLLVNLAIADIVYAAFIAPKGYFKLTSVHHPDGMTGLVLCKLLTGGNVAWVGAVASAVFLVAIAFERYYAVMYPHGYKWKLTNRKLKVIPLFSCLFTCVCYVSLFLQRPSWLTSLTEFWWLCCFQWKFHVCLCVSPTKWSRICNINIVILISLSALETIIKTCWNK